MNKILELTNKDGRTGKEKIVGKMEIKNKTNDFAELYFYGDIVSSSWWVLEKEDKCPQDVADFLNEVKGVKNINIYINSGGGSVFAGIAIYNLLKRNPAYKTVYVDGLAASIASVIMFSGDRIVVPNSAQIMIHKPWSLAWGNANDFRKLADDLDSCEKNILNVYSENLKDGVDIEEIKEMVNNETWLTGEEAANYFRIETSNDFQAVACTSDYFDKYKNVPQKLLNNNLQSNQYNLHNYQPSDLQKQKLKVELDLI